MKRTLIVSTLLFFSLSCSNLKLVSPEKTEEELTSLKEGKEIVSVNDTVIREGYLDLLSSINPRVKNQLKNPLTRKKLVENLINQELMYQESVRRGLDKRKDAIDKAALYKRVIISQALLEEEMKNKAREYYDEKKDSDFTKVGMAQIQINFKSPDTAKDKTTEKGAKKKKPAKSPTAEEKEAALKKAREIKARLDAGEDFAKVAAEVSDDKSSKRKGGDMGKISRNDKRMARRGMDAILKIVFKMKKGDISEPIETKRGYHLVKVTSDPEITPYEEAERIIRFQIQKKLKDDLLAQLKKEARIVYAGQEAKKEPAKKIQLKPETVSLPEPSEESKPADPLAAPKSIKPANPEGEKAENEKAKTPPTVEEKGSKPESGKSKEESKPTSLVSPKQSTENPPLAKEVKPAEPKALEAKKKPTPSLSEIEDAAEKKEEPSPSEPSTSSSELIFPMKGKVSAKNLPLAAKSLKVLPQPSAQPLNSPPPMAVPLEVSQGDPAQPGQAQNKTETSKAETP